MKVLFEWKCMLDEMPEPNKPIIIRYKYSKRYCWFFGKFDETVVEEYDLAYDQEVGYTEEDLMAEHYFDGYNINPVNFKSQPEKGLVIRDDKRITTYWDYYDTNWPIPTVELITTTKELLGI